RSDPGPDAPRLGLEGGVNLLPLTAAVGLVLMSGTWKPGIVLDLWGTPLPLPALVRDLGLLAVIGASLWLTPAGVREKN
ncbi:sodium:proton antiporter, partial [Klebsiella pneumoniae]